MNYWELVFSLIKNATKKTKKTKRGNNMRIGEYTTKEHYSSSIMGPAPGDEDKNTKGTEWEINGVNDSNRRQLRSTLLTLLKANKLIANENMDMAKGRYGTLQSDCTVYCEIASRAMTQRSLLFLLKEFNRAGLNPETLNNNSGTSCHIHNNLQYIENQGSSKKEMVRAAEFLLPILYPISGRTFDKYIRWSRSVFETDGRWTSQDSSVFRNSLLEMANRVDNFSRLSDTRYNICNTQNSKTVEMRIFTNSHNFSYDMTKLYIEFCDLAIDISAYMRDKSYVKEYDTLIDWLDEFCNGNRRRAKLLKPYNLNAHFEKKFDIQVRVVEERWNNIYNRLEGIDVNQSQDNLVNDVIRLCRRYKIEDMSINLGQVNLEDVRKKLDVLYLDEVDNL